MPQEPVANEPESKQSEFEAPKFPEDAAKEFGWDKSALEKESYFPFIEAYCKKAEVKINPEKVHDAIVNARRLNGLLYKMIYPGEENGLPYHDSDHGDLTAPVDTQLFIVAVDHLAKGQFKKDFKENPSLAENLVVANATAANIHELWEWHLRDKPEELQKAVLKKLMDGDPDANPPIKGLTELGYTMDDIQLLVELDDFPKTLDQSVSVAMQHEPGEGSILPQDQALRRAVLRESGACLRTADFLQLINSGYLTLDQIMGVDAVPIDVMRGPLALAYEYLDVRQNAFPPGWAYTKPDGTKDVDAKFVGVNDWYFVEKFTVNVNYAIKYLQEINPKAYAEIRSRINTLAGLVNKYMERVATYPKGASTIAGGQGQKRG